MATGHRPQRSAERDHIARSTLALIAKSPEPGLVKTRLCPPCDEHQAADVASAALADTLDAIAAADVGRRLVALEGTSGLWIPAEMEVVGQSSGGLGERLAALFQLCASGDRRGDGGDGDETHVPGGGTVVVGMDTPQVSADELGDAVAALADPGVDAVLGPALDGGYWAIGFTAEVGQRGLDLFGGVPMSTSHTADVQVSMLRAMGLKVRLLGRHRDIDYWEDAVAVARDHPHLAMSAVVADLQDAARP